MSDCRICGGELVRVGRLRLCRSCSSAFTAIAAPPETWDASRGDIVRETIEAWDALAAELAAAVAERDRLRAALATLTNVAERTVTDLLLDGTAPGTLGAITRLDISVIEARAALAGSTAGGRAMPEPKVLAALQAAGAALAGTYALLTRAGDQEGAAHCMRVIEQLDEALGSFNRAPDVLRCSAYTQVARRAWNHDGRSPKE